MQINTDRLELRVMELEDTVRLLTAVARSLTDLLGDLNEIGKTHTVVLQGLVERMRANDDDEPSWDHYKG